jgi:hypothetical protein
VITLPTVLSLPKITAPRACPSTPEIMSSSHSDESVSRSRSGSEEDRVRRFRSGMPVPSRSETGRSSSDGESNSPPSPQPSHVEPRRKLREDRLRNPIPAQRLGRGRGRGKGKALDGRSRCAVDAVEDYCSSMKDLSLVSSLQSDKLIPEDWSVAVAGGGERANSFKPGWFCMYLDVFLIGLGLPFAAEIRRLLSAFNLVPAQLAPNAWRHLIAFVIACSCSGQEATPQLLAYCYFFPQVKKNSTQFYLRARSDPGQKGVDVNGCVGRSIDRKSDE